MQGFNQTALAIPSSGAGGEASFASTLIGKDAITSVNQFCQRHCKRPITKDDIVYTSATFSGRQHQCTVRLACLDNLEFAGELTSDQKSAKMSAAQQVLNHFGATMEAMPACSKNTASNKKNKLKRTSTASDLGVPLGVPDLKVAKTDAPDTSWKGALNQYFSKIVRKQFGRGEIIYTTGPVQGGYQSTVKIPSLPDQWANEIWAGEVMQKKADAEQSVAKVALESIQADPQLMALYAKPPKQNQWLMNGGLQRQREREAAKASGRGSESSHHSVPVSQPSYQPGGMQPSVATLAALGYYGNYNAPPQTYVPGMPMGFS